MKQPLGKSPPLITAPELAEVIGADLDSINNWVQRGIISRVAIGGRQLRARLFSTEEVYNAALTNELVRLGIQPSSASEAANAVLKEWRGMEPPKGWNVYAVVLPSKGTWTVTLCSQRKSGGALYQGTGSARLQMEFPKHAFAVIPISDVFELVSRKMSALLGG
jgi:hypothetical protein